MEKAFGKLTLDQFRELVRTLPEIRSQIKDLPQVVRAAPRKRIDEILDKEFYWATAYELSFIESLALLFFALGRVGQLMEWATSPDPQQAALDSIRDDDIDDWNGGEGGKFKEKHVVGLTVALQRNILSIMLYHRTLSDLVAEVRTSDEWKEPFFKAVRVDRSILSCPTFSDRLARAELENDKQFFIHLKSALKGPSKKHWEAYHDLRYALCVLRELGFDQMSDAQLEDLLVHQLKLYPNVPSARKNLRKQFTESKRVQLPQKQISGGRPRIR
jgi:hypothetical protein